MLTLFRKGNQGEQAQQKFTKERLRELDLFSLGKRRFQGTYQQLLIPVGRERWSHHCS